MGQKSNAGQNQQIKTTPVRIRIVGDTYIVEAWSTPRQKYVVCNTRKKVT